MKNLQKNLGKNLRFKRIMKVATWISELPNKLTPAPFRLMQIGSLFWQSRALYITVKLQIADELSFDPKSTLDLAEKLSLFEPHLYRLMRFMAAIGIFKETSHRQFIHTKLSLPLTRTAKNNVCDMILMHNTAEMTLPWMDPMEASIKDGTTPFAECHGSDMFTYMDNNKGLNNLFANAMSTVESLTGLEYLHDFNWNEFSRLIDLGGSKGSKSLSILAKNPHLTSTVFDRIEVINGAKDSWRDTIAAQVLNRIDYIGGDLFSSILPVAISDKDLYLSVAVFHLLNDEQAISLIKLICKAMGDFNATIAIFDMVIPMTKANLTDTSFDMQMLMGTNGGERTAMQWQYIFEQANVELIETVSIQSFAKGLVLKKRSICSALNK